MVLIEANKSGAMWIRAIFRYYCQKNDCTVIRESKNVFHPEGKEEDRDRAVFEFERSLGVLLVRVVDARAKYPHRNVNQLDNETIRRFAKELWGV
jgi:hypothetical protein